MRERARDEAADRHVDDPVAERRRIGLVRLAIARANRAYTAAERAIVHEHDLDAAWSKAELAVAHVIDAYNRADDLAMTQVKHACREARDAGRDALDALGPDALEDARGALQGASTAAGRYFVEVDRMTR